MKPAPSSPVVRSASDRLVASTLLLAAGSLSAQTAAPAPAAPEGVAELPEVVVEGEQDQPMRRGAGEHEPVREGFSEPVSRARFVARQRPLASRGRLARALASNPTVCACGATIRSCELSTSCSLKD